MASNAPRKKGTYHYKCEACGKKWVKRHSRGGADYCPKCSSKKYPYHFEKEKLRRMFGEFLCENMIISPSGEPAKCGNSWSSGNSWEGMGQQCRECETMVLPHNLRPLRPPRDSDQGPPHMEKYCEMCQKLGRNCRGGINDAVPEDDDAESVVSTISTVSSPSGSDNEDFSGSDTEDELAEDLSHLSFY